MRMNKNIFNTKIIIGLPVIYGNLASNTFIHGLARAAKTMPEYRDILNVRLHDIFSSSIWLDELPPPLEEEASPKKVSKSFDSSGVIDVFLTGMSDNLSI